MKTRIILAGITLLAAAATYAGDAPPTAETPKYANLEGSSRFSATDGETLYNSVCAACHMPNALGATGAGYYPALAKNDKLAASSYL